MKSTTHTTCVLMQLTLLLAVSAPRPSMALLCPDQMKQRTVTKEFTKFWSLPKDEDELQNKIPQDESIMEENTMGSRMKSANDKDEENIIGSLFQNADLLEVRLDATLCAIFVLARFLVYDLALPRKEIPGMEIVDVVAILDTFSSAGALAILWSIAGIGTGLFDETAANGETNSSYDFSLRTQLFRTTAFSVPLWIFIEKICHWPISAGLTGVYLLQAMILSSLGVLGTMLIGRTISRFLP